MLNSLAGTHNREARKRAASHFKELAKDAWSDWEEIDLEFAAKKVGFVPKGVTKFVKNNKYSIQFYHHQTDWGFVTRLVVRRHDEKPGISWADKQRIKNELVGCDRTAIEVFPPESELVDNAHLYHLWVLPEGFKLPFGLKS